MTLYETAKTLFETWRSKMSEPTYCGDWVTLTNDERRAWEATAMAAMQCADVSLTEQLDAMRRERDRNEIEIDKAFADAARLAGILETAIGWIEGSQYRVRDSDAIRFAAQLRKEANYQIVSREEDARNEP